MVFEMFISYYASSFILAIVSEHKVVHEAKKYLLNYYILCAFSSRTTVSETIWGIFYILINLVSLV